MNNFVLDSRLLRCVYILTWHVFSLLDVNATHVYTSVKQIYVTLFYVFDEDVDKSFKICLSFTIQYANTGDLYYNNFQPICCKAQSFVFCNFI
jgi:hypothetical protein